MNKKDFSKQCLADALFDLLSSCSFEEISIQNVVDKAGFSRMAYYRNFNNLGDVVDYYIESMIQGFHDESSISYEKMGAKPFFQLFFEFMYLDNTKKTFNILKRNGLMDHFYKICKKRVNGKFLPNQDEYFYNFIYGGLIGICINWSNNGYRETPEEMAEKSARLISAITNY